MKYTTCAADISVLSIEAALVHLRGACCNYRFTLGCHESLVDRVHEISLFLAERPCVLLDEPSGMKVHVLTIQVVGMAGIPRDFWFISDGQEVVLGGER